MSKDHLIECSKQPPNLENWMRLMVRLYAVKPLAEELDFAAQLIRDWPSPYNTVILENSYLTKDLEKRKSLSECLQVVALAYRIGPEAMKLVKTQQDYWPKVLKNFPLQLSHAELQGAELNSIDLNKAQLTAVDLSNAKLKRTDLGYADARGAKLEQAVLTHANLHGINLSGANAKSANLRGANLQSANLEGIDLTKADLNYANLKGANLDKAILWGTKMRKAKLDRCSFKEAKYDFFTGWPSGLRRARALLLGPGANLEGTQLDGADLSRCNLKYGILSNASLRGINGTAAHIKHGNFKRADLQDANLEGASLKETNFNRANLRNANLKGANLHSASLVGADLQNADCTAAKLSSCDLKKANLEGAILVNAKLNKASLQKANFRNADLRNADLSEADLTGADLRNACLHQANLRSIRFKQCRFDNAQYDEKTVWPHGFDPKVKCQPKADLKKKELPNIALNTSDLAGKDLTSALLNDKDLSYVDLSCAILDRARLDESYLLGTNLVESSLVNATLHKAEVELADFSGANMTMANLEEANFVDTQFQKTILVKAGLRKAKFLRGSLKDADLSTADLTSTIFKDVNLRGVNFLGADLSSTLFSFVIYDATTVWPDNYGPDHFNGFSISVKRLDRIAKLVPSKKAWSEVVDYLESLSFFGQIAVIPDLLNTLSSWPDSIRLAPSLWKNNINFTRHMRRSWTLVRSWENYIPSIPSYPEILEHIKELSLEVPNLNFREEIFGAKKLKKIEIKVQELTSLSFLEDLSSLEIVCIDANWQELDFSPLDKLEKLHTLNFRYTNLLSIKLPILENVISLTLENCSLPEEFASAKELIVNSQIKEALNLKGWGRLEKLVIAI